MYSVRIMGRLIARAFLMCLVLAGCATVPRPATSPHAGAAGPLGTCTDLIATLDRRAVHADALDAGAFRVEGHPYLRVDRFLASFRDEVADPRAFSAWIDRMQALDLEGRRQEIGNSQPSARAGDRLAETDEALLREVAECGDRMKAADFATQAQRDAFRLRLTAPDDYLQLPRVLGLYPVVSLFVSRGVANWQAEAHRAFSTSPPPPAPGALWYVPAGSTDADVAAAARAVPTAPRDALGVPTYDEDTMNALVRLHAPVWRVRTETDDDRIGSPGWTPAGELRVDIRRPTAYTLVSFTRFTGEILTQLNYVVWFPARPKESALDIYGGFLDGVTYRVTLDTDGEPLLYETIHNCGCYYEAYPTRRLLPRAHIDFPEPPLILQAPGTTARHPALGLELESGTHYVARFFVAERRPGPGDAVALPLAPYNRLRSLPVPDDGRRGMFGPDGIASGSERLERFILWPTGVASPGAMRQWGRHAVAFVGERHFDDPFALDRMFVRAASD
jgi:hypothetical protein